MSNSDWKIPLLAIALSDEAIAVFKNFPDTVENQAQPSFGEIKCDCPASMVVFGLMGPNGSVKVSHPKELKTELMS